MTPDAPGAEPPRRQFLAHALAQGMAAAGLLSLAPPRAQAAQALVVGNVTGLYTVAVARIDAPRTTTDVVAAVKGWPGRIAVGGGRYSMGGQIAIEGGLHLDMRAMNQVVWLRPAERRVRVQAGMRWRDLQTHLDPLGLAVKTMQSYANFSIGGSVSVNAHGRYVGHGPVGHSVRALQLVLADGTVAETSPSAQPDLFRAAIGGYGAIGVITEVELMLAQDQRIERTVEAVPLADYTRHFRERVLADPDAVLHNADLLPPHFDAPVGVTWRRAPDDRPLTEPARLTPLNGRYALAKNAIWAMTELPGGERLRRAVVHPLLFSGPAVKWLNHEASLDVAELEPRTRAISTYVLQEYFVPERQFLPFVRAMVETLRRREVVALNISIRHAPADRVSLLPWARDDVFCLVLYFKQRVHPQAQAEVGRWTRELISLVLAHGGRYYLPYQLHATRAQFEQAYPEAAQLRRVKQQVDPAGRFSNQLWRQVL